jgi:hypothetical protein
MDICDYAGGGAAIQEHFGMVRRVLQRTDEAGSRREEESHFMG